MVWSVNNLRCGTAVDRAFHNAREWWEQKIKEIAMRGKEVQLQRATGAVPARTGLLIFHLILTLQLTSSTDADSWHRQEVRTGR
jgi:hypothetical protein